MKKREMPLKRNAIPIKCLRRNHLICVNGKMFPDLASVQRWRFTLKSRGADKDVHCSPSFPGMGGTSIRTEKLIPFSSTPCGGCHAKQLPFEAVLEQK